ncbi:histidine phosphatase family protein [Paenibacillus sp. GCM10028914]|uniref:histidine phosphatase family protein n=1 Tax=Paenibacillus sp. GCM10028914 TaxID=3273416 RepID=UPI0036D22A6C
MLIKESGEIEVVETKLYFVRHAESGYVEGKERTRGLSEKGKGDSQTILEIFKSVHIEIFVSSPYMRSIETIRPTSNDQHKEITIEEDLRERIIGEFTSVTFKEAKHRVFEDIDYSFPGGESSKEAQLRAITVIDRIIEIHQGKKIVVGTHGDIMTLILNYFDKQYGYSFWESTTIPDIYKLRFKDRDLIEVTRMWE